MWIWEAKADFENAEWFGRFPVEEAGDARETRGVSSR